MAKNQFAYSITGIAGKKGEDKTWLHPLKEFTSS